MPRTNKKACRGSGRLRGAVGGERLQDSSAVPADGGTVPHIACERLAEVARWCVYLHHTEAAVLLSMLTMQRADDAPFSASYTDIAKRAGVAYPLCVHSITVLRQRRLVELVQRGSATQANRYRIPASMPPAGEIVVQLPPAEGGDA